MSKENHIKKGLLSEKMVNFQVEPPESAWGEISAQIQGGRSGRPLFIILAAAAGLALAITVGVNMLEKNPETSVIAESPIADEDPVIVAEQPDKFEEKVLVAMEEVIEEGLQEKILKERLNPIIETEEIVIAENNEQTVEPEGIEQIVELEGIEQNKNSENIEQTEDPEIEKQAPLDSLRLAELMDSISNLNLQIEDIITDVDESNSKWQIGASLTPLYSYRDASSADVTQNLAVNSSETGVLAYSGGVQLSYLQSDRLSIESGIIYSKMGLAIGDYNAFFGAADFSDNIERASSSIVSLSNSIGTIVSGDVDVFSNAYSGTNSVSDYQVLEDAVMNINQEPVNSFTQSFEYLEIPFNLKYKIFDRNLDVLLIGGISTNFLIGNHVSANTDNGMLEIGQVQDIRNVNYSGNAGIGFVYSFLENFSLSIEPRFRYYLNSINSSALPVTRPYALGVYTGVNYSF